MKVYITDQFLMVNFNSPQNRNAFSVERARVLKKSIKNKKIKGIILYSEGSVFCAGGDLAEYSRLKTKQQGVRINHEITQILTFLAQLPVPKLVFVDGDCFGGGIELLSCFDWIVATPKSFFALWQRQMTLSFGWGGYARLLKRIPESQLKAWVLSGEIRSTQGAFDLGLVNEIIPSFKRDEYFESWRLQQIQLTSESYSSIHSLNIKNERKVFDKLWWSVAHRQKLFKVKR